MGHLNTSSVPLFGPNCDFHVKSREGYLITFELFSHPQGSGNLTKNLEKKNQMPHTRTPLSVQTSIPALVPRFKFLGSLPANEKRDF